MKGTAIDTPLPLVSSLALALSVVGCSTSLVPPTETGPHRYEGVFGPTGSMTAVRVKASATLLRDGKVLVVGGLASPDLQHPPVASAELYDPTTGSFSGVAAPGDNPFYPTAVLLPDGRVFLYGTALAGALEGSGLPAAELYDPVTQTFSMSGPIGTPRAEATATLLADGRVLVAGGTSGDTIPTTPLASAELYDPRSGTFRPTGPLSSARKGATAVLLPDGRVLIAGGIDSAQNVLASAELYDPKAGTFSATAPLTTARQWPTAVLLGAGVVLIVGGGIAPDHDRSADLYDPGTGTFSPTGSLSSARDGAAVTLLQDGRVLVAGGEDQHLNVLASAELYDPSGGTFAATGSMARPRFGAAGALLADGWVLIAGGGRILAGGDATSAAELFH